MFNQPTKRRELMSINVRKIDIIRRDYEYSLLNEKKTTKKQKQKPISKSYSRLKMTSTRSRREGPCNSILSHGAFTDWSIFSIPFLSWKKGSSGLGKQWRQLVPCDWSWHSHGSLIPGKFDLKINRSMKKPWQVYNSHTSSYAKKGRISTRCVATTMVAVVGDRQKGRMKWREPTSRFPLQAWRPHAP